jgi:hypothetical protein
MTEQEALQLLRLPEREVIGAAGGDELESFVEKAAKERRSPSAVD